MKNAELHLEAFNGMAEVLEKTVSKLVKRITKVFK